MERLNLGELEELVLLAVAILDENAYGVTVRKEIEDQAGRELNISSVHTALDRLEKKGMLESYSGGATAERGGRRKRLFKVTAYGVKAIDHTRGIRNNLYNRIPSTAFNLSGV